MKKNHFFFKQSNHSLLLAIFIKYSKYVIHLTMVFIFKHLEKKDDLLEFLYDYHFLPQSSSYFECVRQIELETSSYSHDNINHSENFVHSLNNKNSHSNN